jgi:anti-sigma factor RsiW
MIGHDELMRYLDGELSPERARAVEDALERSTELRRELAIFRGMKADLEKLGDDMGSSESVWRDVNRRITRPVGWALVILGGLTWVGFGVYSYLTGTDALWEKLATAAVVVGLATLLLSAAVDRYRELKTDPYRGVQR